VWYFRLMRKKGTGAEWERLRNVAANMIDQKMKPAAIAPLLDVDVQTVRSWQRAYRRGGRAALVSRKPPGRPTRLKREQKQQLAQMLLKTPVECGFDKYLWTQQLISDLIQREFGVSYHHDHVGLILRELGFTHQKPQRRSRERDESRIQSWRQETWPTLLKKVHRSAE
jgi:transposase